MLLWKHQIKDHSGRPWMCKCVIALILDWEGDPQNLFLPHLLPTHLTYSAAQTDSLGGILTSPSLHPIFNPPVSSTRLAAKLHLGPVYLHYPTPTWVTQPSPSHHHISPGLRTSHHHIFHGKTLGKSFTLLCDHPD